MPRPPDVYLEILENLFDSYVSMMKSEFDFPGRPWTPQRDGDDAAIMAQRLIKEMKEPTNGPA